MKCLFVWVLGAMFTLGVMIGGDEPHEEGSDYVGGYITISAIMWPILLGAIVGERLPERTPRN